MLVTRRSRTVPVLLASLGEDRSMNQPDRGKANHPQRLAGPLPTQLSQLNALINEPDAMRYAGM